MTDDKKRQDLWTDYAQSKPKMKPLLHPKEPKCPPKPNDPPSPTGPEAA